jgi:hypothetical protein
VIPCSLGKVFGHVNLSSTKSFNRSVSRDKKMALWELPEMPQDVVVLERG